MSLGLFKESNKLILKIYGQTKDREALVISEEEKEISLEYSLEGLMLKLKLQSFGYLMRRTDTLEKTLMLGKIEGRRRGRQRVRW